MFIMCSKINKPLLILCMSLMISGCASTKSPRTIPLGKKYKSYIPPEEIENDKWTDKIIRTNSAQLTLDEALSLTLMNNPELKIAAWDIKSKNYLVNQSGLWENPELEIGLENFGAKTYSISLSQKIELGGKRASRIALAKVDKDISAWDYEVKRLELIIDAGKQFLYTLEIQEKISLLSKLIKLAEDSLNLTKTRYKAGAGTVIDVIRAQKDLDRVKLEQSKESNNLKLQYSILAAFWGDKKYYFNSIKGELLIPENIPDLNSLISKLTNNPDIARWVFEMESRRYELENAEAEKYPDLNISAGYEREVETREDIIGLGFSFSLPILNRNQGAVNSSEINLHKMRYLKNQVDLKILNDLNEAYTRLKNNLDEVGVLKDKIIKGLRKAYNEAMRFYKMGKITALELLSLQQELIETEIKSIEVLSEFYKAKYEIELLIGDEVKINVKGEKK